MNFFPTRRRFSSVINNAFFYIAEAFKSALKNSLMSVCSIITIFICASLLIISYSVAVNIRECLRQIESAVGIAAIIDDSVPDEELDKIYNAIADIDDVKEVHFVSAQAALASFADSLEEGSDIVMGLENDNPLRRSFEVVVYRAKDQKAVVKLLSSETFVDMGVVKVRQAQDVTEFLEGVSNFANIVCAVIIFVTAVLSVILITTTIKITVASRKNEITIMKYVGATDSFVKWPFRLEGAFIGGIGATVAAAVSAITYPLIVHAISEQFSFITNIASFLPTEEVFPIIAPIAIISGILLGALSAVGALRKYLEV
ncbi:MAG: permease-like cell division protein FtsX [Clostridiales bacterium]|nr:permease-like cell division protein FtsX [Clostridiales bacterium]